MTIKRNVELIEDGRRYRRALTDIAKLVDGPLAYRSSQIMAIITKSKAAYGEHTSRCGPWPMLIDHIAQCKDCEPTRNLPPNEIGILGIHLCQEGKDMMTKFYDHQCAVRSKADREALE